MKNLTENFTSDKAKYIIENPSGDPKIIEETIIQFFSLRPHKATQFLLAALQDPSFKKETLIKLITHIPLREIKTENRIIGSSDPAPAYDDEGGPVYINHSTALLDALLRNDYEITKSIVLYQKPVLNDALLGLLELDSIRKLDYVKHDHYYPTVDSRSTHVKDTSVLSALDTAVTVFVDLNYEPKLPESRMDYMLIGYAPKVPLLCEAKRLNRIVKLDDMLQFIKRNESEMDGFRSILYSFNEFPHKLGTL
ncbi:MAG: hypothetical protein JSS53_02900, partial [Proteobacteria bacterium]|nr:hypothetical protein [Pseudomonadota bacterium]